MRKLMLLVAVIVSSAAVVATSASALNAPRTFSLLDVTMQQQPIGGFSFDRPPVAGDQIGFVDSLYRWKGVKKGARVGHLQALLTFITGFDFRSPRAPIVLVDAQVYLPGGTVMLNGYIRVNPGGPSKFTLPVVGGTGVYANARGYVTVRDLGNGESGASNINFHLLP